MVYNKEHLCSSETCQVQLTQSELTYIFGARLAIGWHGVASVLSGVMWLCSTQLIFQQTNPVMSLLMAIAEGNSISRNVQTLFQDYAYIMSANIPVTRVSHLARTRIREGGHSPWHGNGCESRKEGELDLLT